MLKTTFWQTQGLFGPCVLFGEFSLTVGGFICQNHNKGVLELPWECFLRPEPQLDFTKVLLLPALLCSQHLREIKGIFWGQHDHSLPPDIALKLMINLLGLEGPFPFPSTKQGGRGDCIFSPTQHNKLAFYHFMTAIHCTQLQLPIKCIQVLTVVSCEPFMSLGNFFKNPYYFWGFTMYKVHSNIHVCYSTTPWDRKLCTYLMDEESEA